MKNHLTLRGTKVAYILALFLIAVFLFSCSSNKEVSTAKQVYHNITGRNNPYFNADLEIKTIQDNIEQSHQDDYSEILPLHTNRDPDIAKTYSSNLDIVIKKCSHVIKKHEPSKWTDNSYLLVGKAYFLKGDYETALETFQYITTNYKEGQQQEQESAQKKKKKKKKKKHKKKKRRKKGKPKSAKQIKEEKKKEAVAEKKEGDKEEDNTSPFDFLKHKPSRPKALLWLVDTYTKLEKYKEAESVVTIIEADEDFPDKLQDELYIAKANLFLEKGSIERAIEPLTSLISELRRKKDKARYYYILGQIYERLKMYPSASENYQQVLKCRPEYEMEFNAKMSLARVAGYNKGTPTEDIEEILTKLLKDNKNEDFFDQINYALAELYLNNGDKEKAIDYLKASVQSSTTNSEQKALSFKKLADIYFKDEAYRKAQAYYDSTITVLPSDHEDYNLVESRNEILKDLVKQLNIIEEQDSLQYIGSLSEKEREQFIKDIVKEKEKEKAEKESVDNSDFMQKNEKKDLDNAQASTSGWYFYNAGARSSGYNNFIRKWGKRTLEDNWRRSNKGSFSEEVLEPEEEATPTDEELLLTNAEDLDEEALKNAIPLTEEQLKRSNDLMSEAYYKLGNIYRIDLKKYQKAIEAFETLVKRFPDSKFLAETYYNLYILYSDLGNKSKKEHYKDLLLTEFPKSKYAKIILDPDFLKKIKEKDKLVGDYYSIAYNMYLNGQIDAALKKIRAADSIFPENPLKPKFALLEAYALGKTNNVEGYVEALQKIVDDYPKDDVREKAVEILAYLKESDMEAYEKQVNISEYEYDPDALHFFVVSYSDPQINSNDLVNAIAEYNDVNRSLEDLKVNSLALNHENTLVIVKSFENKKKALSYYRAIKESKSAFADIPQEDSLHFSVISDINFNKVITHREFDSYYQFFNTRYIQ